jgi:hypothetical protein
MALGIIHDREGESMEVEPLPPSTSHPRLSVNSAVSPLPSLPQLRE